MAQKPSQPESTPADDGRSREPERRALGKFEIVRKIGSGGMGAVYLATDRSKNRSVALKILPKEKAANPILVQRFEAESRSASLLKHPNIIDVYEAGQIDGYLYMSLEFVDGTDAHNLVERRGVMPVKRSIEVIRQITAALDHAASKNIVHRDIKPSNILIGRDGSIKLADMGLARSLDETTETGITRAGTTVGTVDYMSPEQARDSKAADARSDIYSLGCTWFHLLTGQAPFSDGSMTNKLYAHASARRPDPRELNPSIPEGVVAVMHKMMAAKPEDRYQSPRELLRELETAHLRGDQMAQQMRQALEESDEDFGGDAGTATEESGDGGGKRLAARSPRARGGQDEVETKEADLTPGGKSTKDSGKQKKLDRDAKLAGTGKNEKGGKSGRNTSERGKKLPPPTEKAPMAINVDILRFASIAAGIAALIGCIWWMSTRYANVFDSSGVEANRGSNAGEKFATAGGKFEGDQGTVELNGSTKVDAAPRPTFRLSDATHEIPNPNNGARLTLGREEDRERIPPWVAEVWDRTALSQDSSAPQNSPPQPIGAGDPRRIGGTVAAPAASKYPVLRIGRGETGLPGDHATLEAALDALPKSGGIVLELVGKGPFFLPPTKLEGRENLIITSTGTDRAVVVLLPPTVDTGSGALTGTSPPSPRHRPVTKNLLQQGLLRDTDLQYVSTSESSTSSTVIADDSSAVAVDPLPNSSTSQTIGPMLSLVGGALTVVDVDVVAFASQFPDSGEVTLIDVHGGDLALRRSTVSLVGQRAGETVAVCIRGQVSRAGFQAGSGARILLDRVHVAGQKLCTLALTSRLSECVVFGSLLAGCDASVVRVGSRASSVPAGMNNSEVSGTVSSSLESSPIRPEPKRIVRVLSSVLVANRPLFELHPERELEKTPPMLLVTHRGAFCRPASTSDASMIQLTGWPRTPSPRTDRSQLHHLDMKMHACHVLGFRSLVVDKKVTETRATDSENWKTLWGTAWTATRQEPSPWPAKSIDDPAGMTRADWVQAARDTEAFQGANAVGCDFAKLPKVDEEAWHAATQLVHRPRLAGGTPLGEKPARRVEVDLGREDLSSILNTGTWPTGTLFIARGTGVRPLAPVIVSGKSLKIIFETQGKFPLILEPRTSQRTDPGSTALPAWITIRNGTLEIEGGSFRIPASSKSAGVRSLLRVVDGNFIIRRCILTGPQVESPGFEALIHWENSAEKVSTGRVNRLKSQSLSRSSPLQFVNTSTNSEQAKAGEKRRFDSPGVYTHSGLIENSYLSTTRKLVEVNVESAGLSIANSVGVGLGDGISIRPPLKDEAGQGAIDIRRSTLSATGAIFTVLWPTIPAIRHRPVLRFFLSENVFAPPAPAAGSTSYRSTLFASNDLSASRRMLICCDFSNAFATEIAHFSLNLNKNDNDKQTFEKDWAEFWGRACLQRPLITRGGVVLKMSPLKAVRLHYSDFQLSGSAAANRWSRIGKAVGADLTDVEMPDRKPTDSPGQPAGSPATRKPPKRVTGF